MGAIIQPLQNATKTHTGYKTSELNTVIHSDGYEKDYSPGIYPRLQDTFRHSHNSIMIQIF